MVLDVNELVLGNDSHAFFAPAITPQDSTLGEESRVLSTIGCELGVLIIQTQDDR
jgi:hypothetical protein